LAAEIRGKSILLPRSDRAGEALPATLERSGARVTQVVAYRTRLSAALPGPVWDMILRGAADVITFASPSAFHSFFEEWQNAGRLSPPDAILAAIGPTTATAIREAGWNCAIVAAQSTAQGLAAAITAHFRGNT
jgi:uroporphyrinogen-III synthase